MKTLLIVFCLVASSLWASDSMTIFEADGVTQTNRPFTFGRAFLQGEIATGNCPRPKVGGVAIATNSWQADIKNAWPDGSVKFAIISFISSLSSGGNIAVTFQNGTCNNSGQLTQAQMIGFNSGNWGAEIDVTANSTTPTANAITMLGNTDPASNTFNDCKNDYWLKGPVVTAVIVQDCTPTTAFDFGWQWDGTTMSTACLGNASQYCSLHPWYVLYFYPSTNQVRADMILENDWLDRWQDQLIQVVYKTGNPLASVLSYTTSRKLTGITETVLSSTVTDPGGSFTASDVGMSWSNRFIDTTICSVTNSTTANLCARIAAGGGGTNETVYMGDWLPGQRYEKTFWTGAGAPGSILIDHNWAYLTSTKMFPPYDQAVTASPDSNVLAINNCTGSDYACFIGSVGGILYAADKGDRGGFGTLYEGYAGNKEGAPLQREELLYLYNMGADCGTANGKCSEAWYMLTGQHGLRDSGLAANVTGGAGVFASMGNVPFHNRESQTKAGSYYCAGQADKAAVPSTACGSTNTAFGRSYSTYYNLNSTFTGGINGMGLFPSGTARSKGNWGLDQAHWVDHSLVPYLLTGDPYQLDEIFMSAGILAGAANSSFSPSSRNNFYAQIPDLGGSMRTLAWGVQGIARARLAAVDGTLEQTYWDSILASNAEIREGIMDISGTALTPPSPNETCTSFDWSTSNRWDWGRCAIASYCQTGACTPVPQLLHAPGTGHYTMFINGNQGFSGTPVISATATNPVSITNQGTKAFPASTTFVYIFGATGNWTGLNGTWQLTNTGGSGATVPFDATAVVGALTGSVMVTWGGFGAITGVTPGSPTTITANSLVPTELKEIYGLVDQGGSNYSNLNAIRTFTSSTNTATVAFNSTGYPTFSQTGGRYMDEGLQCDLTSDMVDPWMEHDWEIVLGEITSDYGISYYNSVALDQKKKLTEQILDPTYNPFLVGTYVRPLKDSSFGHISLAANYGTTNPPFSTWAGVKAAYTPVSGNVSTFNNILGTVQGFPCDDHGYSLMARAAGAYIGGANSTCTNGICTGTAAQNWLLANVPYFNNTPPASSGCGTSDKQIKFALAPSVSTTLGTQLAPVSRWTAGATIQ